MIEESKQLQIPCAILSLNAEKAFERLEWQYLWAVPQRFQLGDRFINLVQVLWANPSAVISTNGQNSNHFSIFCKYLKSSDSSQGSRFLVEFPYYLQYQEIVDIFSCIALLELSTA